VAFARGVRGNPRVALGGFPIASVGVADRAQFAVRSDWRSDGRLARRWGASLGSLVGFVTVLGIAARNGILLVSHYRHLEQEEGQAFGPALILKGSEERLIPDSR